MIDARRNLLPLSLVLTSWLAAAGLAVYFHEMTSAGPCGMELIRPPKTGQGIVATEGRDEALHFFIDHWPAGTHRIDFLVRAELDGTVSVPMPELVPMYDDPLPTAVYTASQWVVRGEDE